MILIGSTALQYRIPGHRKTKDIDLIASSHEEAIYFINSISNILEFYPLNESKYFVKTKTKIFEITVAWEGTNRDLIKVVDTDPKTIFGYVEGYDVLIPSLDILYMLKLSHRFLKNSPHFLKTMRDIQYMRANGAELAHEELLRAREAETYAYKHPRLKTSKKNFFKEETFYVYDHDSIHVAMQHLAKPAYSYFKPAGSEVFCDRDMFLACPRVYQLLAVLEESYVLALERSQIPYRHISSKASFDMALEKVCTSITSGWFREFAWENYDAVQNLYDDRYVERFWTAVETGVVIPVSQ